MNEKIKHLDIIYSLLNRHIIYRTKIVKVLIRTDYQSEFTKSTRRSVPPHAGEVTTYAGPSGYGRVPAVNVKHAVDAVADVVVVVVPVDLVGVCGQRLHDVEGRPVPLVEGELAGAGRAAAVPAHTQRGILAVVAVVVVVGAAAAVAGPGALPQPDHRLEAAERVHVIHVEVPRPGLLATGVVLPADGEIISVSSQAEHLIGLASRECICISKHLCWWKWTKLHNKGGENGKK